MVSKNIKINIKEISADNVGIEIELNGTKKIFEGNIINSHGLFGVEFPSEFNLLMREFPFETKRLVGEINKRFIEETELQAA